MLCLSVSFEKEPVSKIAQGESNHKKQIMKKPLITISHSVVQRLLAEMIYCIPYKASYIARYCNAFFQSENKQFVRKN